MATLQDFEAIVRFSNSLGVIGPVTLKDIISTKNTPIDALAEVTSLTWNKVHQGRGELKMMIARCKMLPPDVTSDLYDAHCETALIIDDIYANRDKPEYFETKSFERRFLRTLKTVHDICAPMQLSFLYVLYYLDKFALGDKLLKEIGVHYNKSAYYPELLAWTRNILQCVEHLQTCPSPNVDWDHMCKQLAFRRDYKTLLQLSNDSKRPPTPGVLDFMMEMGDIAIIKHLVIAYPYTRMCPDCNNGSTASMLDRAFALALIGENRDLQGFLTATMYSPSDDPIYIRDAEMHYISTMIALLMTWHVSEIEIYITEFAPDIAAKALVVALGSSDSLHSASWLCAYVGHEIIRNDPQYITRAIGCDLLSLGSTVHTAHTKLVLSLFPESERLSILEQGVRNYVKIFADNENGHNTFYTIIIEKLKDMVHGDPWEKPPTGALSALMLSTPYTHFFHPTSRTPLTCNQTEFMQTIERALPPMSEDLTVRKKLYVTPA